ncbi:hypothetical protein D3C71_1828270 [compost metagenome]
MHKHVALSVQPIKDGVQPIAAIKNLHLWILIHLGFLPLTCINCDGDWMRAMCMANQGVAMIVRLGMINCLQSKIDDDRIQLSRLEDGLGLGN